LEGPVESRAVPVLTSARYRTRGGPADALMAQAVKWADPIAFRVNLRRMGRLIAEVRPDVVLAAAGGFPAGRSVLACAVAGKRAGARVAMTVVGLPVPRRPALELYERSVDKLVWGSVDAVAVSGSAILARLETLRGLPPGLGRLIPNALPEGGPVHQPHAGPLTVGCLARVTRSKGMLDLAAAFERLSGTFPDARLRIVGDGDAREEMRGRLVAAGLEGRVELPGYISGDEIIAEEVSRIDVYVLPTHGETHPGGEEGGGPPYSILEAMRAGTGIVTTSVGSIADGMTDGREGLLVPPKDVEALSDAIARMLADEELRQRLGQAARDRFMRDFTLTRSRERAAALAADLTRLD
jgi:glycosyltransferase involved in cell wall biosynthesis